MNDDVHDMNEEGELGREAGRGQAFTWPFYDTGPRGRTRTGKVSGAQPARAGRTPVLR